MNGEKYSFTHAWQPLAATCSHSSGRKWPPAFSCHRQPLAATCSHSSGRQWPPAFSFHRQPLAATCSQSSGRKWPPEQVAASGRKWPQVGRKWPQVAASGRKWPPEQVAASGRLCQNQIRALLHALWELAFSGKWKKNLDIGCVVPGYLHVFTCIYHFEVLTWYGRTPCVDLSDGKSLDGFCWEHLSFSPTKTLQFFQALPGDSGALLRCWSRWLQCCSAAPVGAGLVT